MLALCLLRSATFDYETAPAGANAFRDSNTAALRFEYLDQRLCVSKESLHRWIARVSRDSQLTFLPVGHRPRYRWLVSGGRGGKPIDEFGARVSEPTINRFTFAVETQRVLDQKSRTIVFARYSYEDVRLFNLQSLVVRPILQPDRAIRLSRIGGSLVRDTRERCERSLLGNRRIMRATTGAPGEICRDSQSPREASFSSITRGAHSSEETCRSISFKRATSLPKINRSVERFAGNVTLGCQTCKPARSRR